MIFVFLDVSLLAEAEGGVAIYGSHILSDIRKLNSPTTFPCLSLEVGEGADRPDAAAE